MEKTSRNFEKSGERVMETNTHERQSALSQCVIHLLHRAGQCAGDLFTEEVIDGGLTPRQYAGLVAVSLDEGLSQTDLVERTGIDRSTLADIIRRMLKKGLVSRRRTRHDARVYSVKLTDTGREALQAAQPAAHHADERLLAALEPGKRDEFLRSLNMIVQAIGPESAKNGR